MQVTWLTYFFFMSSKVLKSTCGLDQQPCFKLLLNGNHFKVRDISYEQKNTISEIYPIEYKLFCEFYL